MRKVLPLKYVWTNFALAHPVNTSQGGFQKSDPGFCLHGLKSKCPVRQHMLRQIIHNFNSYMKNQRAFIATKLNFRRNKNNKSDFAFFKVRFGFHAEIVFKNQVGYFKIRFRIFFYRNKNRKSRTDFQKTNVNFNCTKLENPEWILKKPRWMFKRNKSEKSDLGLKKNRFRFSTVAKV